MTIIQSIILGIIEGLTEFLPISSTAHLDLSRQLMGIPSIDFIKAFEVIIQLGAILAVCFVYWPRITKNLKLSFLKLGAAFLPTAVFGLILYKIIKTYFFGNTWLMISTLFIGGIGIILFEKFHTEKKETNDALESISYKQAFLIGCAQSLAMVPGVSRSAATIIGGLSLGISRKTIVDFSFLLAIPTMLAATLKDVVETKAIFNNQEFALLLIGFGVSFFVALAVIKWFMDYIQKHNFKVFGWYRIFIAVACALIFWKM